MTDVRPVDFQSAVFALADEASASSEAEALRDVVHGFGRGSEPGVFSNREVYPQYAGSVGHQALGYLLMEQVSQSGDAPVIARLPPLEADERRVLTSAHGAFAGLGARCLAPLVDTSPAAATAALPYTRYVVGLDAHPAFSLLDGPAAHDAVALFAQHPAMQLALETAAAAQVMPDVGAIVQTLNVIEAEAGRLDPSEADAFFHPPPLPLPKSILASVVPFACALTCMRASLYLVSELVYRQVIHGGPICVTEAQIRDMGPRVERAFGSTSTVDYVADRSAARMPWHAERVLVLHAEGTRPADGTVHEIAGSNINLMSAEVRVQLNDADRWMNPAPALLAAAREAWERDR